MDMKNKLSYLTEILENLVDKVEVVTISPAGKHHHFDRHNVITDVVRIAEHPHVKIKCKVYFDGMAHHAEHIVRPNNYKNFVVGQGKQIANALKADLSHSMLDF